MFMTPVQHDTRTGNLQDSAAFKVEMNAMLFHSVIDGIYADKIRAPMRELTTNARDGHAANGNLDEPFDVFLPSPLDATFKVRDYGTSLSHEDIMGIYSTMFASTKRADNDAVGMIGLGSKSPFAYTSVFTVTAWMAGYKRTYSAFIGADGVPQIALLDMVESDGRQGIEVSFPVKPEDISKFRNAAPDVLFGFDPYPNILNETYVRPVPEIVYQGDGWTLYNETTTPYGRTLMARQGCVLYPISHQPLNLGNTDLFNWPVVIDFPIGDLSVSTSREALGYDRKTVTNLKDRIEQTLSAMKILVKAEIEAAPSYLDACHILATALEPSHPKHRLYYLLKDHLEWGGKPLQYGFTVILNHSDCRAYRMTSDRVVMGEVKSGLSHRTTLLTEFYSKPKEILDQTLVVGDIEGTSKASSRMRSVIAENINHKNVLWVKAPSIEKMEMYADHIGNPKWIDLSKIEPLILSKDKKTKTAARLLSFMAPSRKTNRHSDLASATHQLVEPSSDMIYVRQDGNDYHVTSKGAYPWKRLRLSNLIYDLYDRGLLPKETKVYLLNKATIKVLNEVPMRSLESVVQENIRATIDLKKLTISSNDYYLRGKQNMAQAIQKKAGSLKMPDDIIRACEALSSRVSEQSHSSLVAIIRDFCPDEYEAAINRSDPSVKTYDDMIKKYPLLPDCIHYTEKLTHYMELLRK